jgi:3',5'-cyclic AMP phosphodiesterase CpdA
MKIGFFSDLHCGREEITNGNRYPSRSLGKLQKLLLDFENIGVDLAICLGDVINGSASKADDIEHLSRVAKVIRDSSVPVLVMMGNHDFKNLDDDTFYRISDFVRPPFVCRADEVNLIFLDANYSSDGTRYGTPDTQYNWKNTYIPEDQIEALRDVLANSPEGSRFWILCHQCLDIGVEERHIVNNVGEVLDIIGNEGRDKVEFVICGHYHPGAYSIDIGREFVTLPAVCTGKDFNPNAALILDTSHIPNFRG